jgi:antitoxin HicB
MTKPKKNPHEGSTLDDFLREKGMLEEVEAEAKRRIRRWLLEEDMKKRGEANKAPPLQARRRA